MRRKLRFIAIAIAIAWLSSCVQTPPNIEQLDLQARQSNDVSNPEAYVQPDTLDALFVELDYKLGGFSGLYVDKDNTLVVGLTTGNKASLNEASIISTIEETLGSSFFEDVARTESNNPALSIRTDKYSFKELNAWRNHASKLFADGVTFLDVDEIKNKVVLGVENEKMKSKVLEGYKRERLAIPSDAFEIIILPAAQTSANINQKNRPTVGGLEINYKKSPNDIGFYSCTLGYNVTRLGVKGFITNSHCSKTWGYPDSTIQYQIANYAVGYEVHDPTYNYSWWPWVCSPGFRCRNSDSAFYRYYSSVNSQKRVADVTSYSTWSGGSHTYNQTRDVSTYQHPAVGHIVYKVGQKSGGTTGAIGASCFTILQAGSNRILRCQYRANMLSRSGDSGSPVFARSCISTGCPVKPTGLHWGGVNVLNYAYFSPLNAVMNEMQLTASNF